MSETTPRSSTAEQINERKSASLHTPASEQEESQETTKTANIDKKTPASNDAQQDSTKQDEEEQQRPAWRVALIMLALCLAVSLHAIDITIVTTALPTITEALNSDAAYTWIGSAYLLAVSATTIVWGKLSDIFGRRPVSLIMTIGGRLSVLSN